MNKVHISRILVLLMMFISMSTLANSINDTNSSFNETISLNTTLNITPIDVNSSENISIEIINVTNSENITEVIQKVKDSIRVIKTSENEQSITFSYVGTTMEQPIFRVISERIRYGLGNEITLPTRFVNENTTIEVYDGIILIMSDNYGDVELEIIPVEEIAEADTPAENKTNITIVNETIEREPTNKTPDKKTKKQKKQIIVNATSQQYYLEDRTSIILDLAALALEIVNNNNKEIIHVNSVFIDSVGDEITTAYTRTDNYVNITLNESLKPGSYTLISSLYYNKKSYIHSIAILVDAIKISNNTVKIYNTTYNTSVATILDSKGETIELEETIINRTSTQITPTSGNINSIIIHSQDVATIDTDYIGLDTNIFKLQSDTEVFKQSYAIDPSQADITTIEITTTAKGNTLYKCVDWNFTTQTCYGKWNFIQYITPGKDYTVIVDKVDPAFGEGDVESLSDSCSFSDEGTSGDGDSTVDCQTEINANNNGLTADLDDLETIGTSATLNANYTNSFLADAVNGVNATIRYQRQTNSQVGDTTASIQVFDAGAYVTACTDIITIGTWESYTCDLSAYITTEAELNNINIRVLFDTSQQSQPKQEGKTYVDYMYLDINYDAADVQAPTFSTIETNIASPTTYSLGTTYIFNTSWIDNTAIGVVLIEENFTGIIQNSTPSSSGAVYSYSTPLAAGTYSWKYYANDSVQNINSTPSQTFIVNKADSAIVLELNETSANITAYNSDTINITANGGEGTIEIFRDGVNIAQGSSSITQLEIFNTVGTYNITTRYNATQNYTASSQTFFVTLADDQPPGDITGLANITSGDTWIYWSWTNPVDTDFDHVEVWINGTFRDNVTTNFINVTGLSSDTEYEVQIRTADIYNNVGGFIVDLGETLISLDTTPPVISEVINHSITEQTTTINWTTDEIANTRVKYGTSSGVYTESYFDALNELEHTAPLIGLTPVTTYYYVVNSTDAAGNSVETSEYTFTTLADTQAPTYSGITATPTSPITYSGSTSTFNITWNDNIEIDTVTIEHNFTGSFTNYSVTNISDEFTYSYDLSAGVFSWKYYANDSFGNLNNTPSQTYIVNKATPNLLLELNEVDANITVNEDTNVNVTGSMILPGSGSLELRRNGTLIGVNNDQVTNIASYQPGEYLFRLDYSGSINYTSSTIYKTLNASDVTPPTINLNSPANDTVDFDKTIIFTYSNSDNVAVDYCNLYINGTFNQTDSSISPTDSFTITTMVNGSYEWLVECVDTTNNYANSTSRQFNSSVLPAVQTIRNPYYISAWDDADAITLSDINATDANTESRTIARNTIRQIDAMDFNASIPEGSTITAVTFSVRHLGNTRTTYDGLNWYNGSEYIGGGCAPVIQTGAYRTDICDLYSQINTVEKANNISLEYIVSAADQGGGGSITIDHMYVTISYLAELTSPSLTVTNATININETFKQQVIATDNVGIESYAVNDTVRFSINSSGYIANISNLGVGTTEVNVIVTDPSGNSANNTITITVADLVDIEVIASNGIVIYNSTGQLVASGSGSFTERLLRSKLYTIEYSSSSFYGIQNTTLYDVNLSKDLNFTTQYNESYSGALPEYITEMSPIFALDEPDINYSYATISLPKKEVVIDYINHCTDWNFATQECGTWEVNETSDYEFTENSTHITFNVTGFDAFGGGPGDTLPNMSLIEVYDVTGQSDVTTGGSLVSSGVDTEFDLLENNVYRIEFNITNEAKKWILNAADVARHSGLNSSWNVTNISYNIAGTDYVGGTWIGDTVTWNLGLGGTLDQGESGIWSYVLHVNTSVEEKYLVDFLVNDTSKDSGSVDQSNYSIIPRTWDTYYGIINLTIILGDTNENSLYSWFDNTATGVMYAIDSDASVNFANVFGIGRDENDVASSNDFTEIDVALNLTGKADSITNYYALDASTPKSTRSYTVNGQSILNVPMINSTDNANFQTGIMWDNSTDTDGEYSEGETIIFITNIENSLPGLYGTYDYEFIVPYSLGKTQGATSTIDIYIELE